MIKYKNYDPDYHRGTIMNKNTNSSGKGGRHLKETREVKEVKETKETGNVQEAPVSERPEKKKKHVGRTVIIVIAAVILVILLAVFLIFRDMYGQLNSHSRTTPAPTAIPSAAVEATPEVTATPEPTAAPLTEEEKAKLEEMELRSSLAESAEEVMSDKNVYNILLIGSDGRTEELERSDAMILLSINKTTKTMWLTSLMRDTQVEIADWGTGHLNWATRFGGVDMLINTIESTRNFAIDVDNWAMVDFLDFAEIASKVGPITVTVTKEEAADINIRIREACRMNDAYYGTDTPRCYFPTDQDGTYEITDGFQILGYCRERHYGGDTGRSEKQREVLMQMWNNVKKMSLTEQYALAKEIMSIVSTDITMGQCASLLLQAPDFLTYDIQMQQCPTPGSFWRGLDANGLSIYNTDFVVNRNFLRATIYGEEMTAGELTSYWTGNAVQVYYPPEKETGDENG